MRPERGTRLVRQLRIALLRAKSKVWGQASVASHQEAVHTVPGADSAPTERSKAAGETGRREAHRKAIQGSVSEAIPPRCDLIL
ncbi:hypothetical protein KTH_54080 [Thermosporothrix hazakensis]|nr:hypothetical protein KTH_54080 [Thermosporothrix hazakensis]